MSPQSAPSSSNVGPYEFLPRLGSAEEFAALRKIFQEAGYTYEGICARLAVESLPEFSSGSPDNRKFEQPVDALIGLFFDCGLVPEAVVTALLSPETVAVLESFQLVTRVADLPGVMFAPVAILPAHGFLTVCDHDRDAPKGAKRELPTDVVYPAILNTTRSFLLSLPDEPCDAMLDVGTGTGIAAMLGARKVNHAWATDITARAVLFAEFNRRLAGLENMTVAEGDMYAPVAGLTFDRITIHPPYVPSKKSQFVYRDAGEDGEQILRRAVEGLPDILRPGGRFHSLQMATDRKDETFEQRVRKWLGEKHEEFDVLVAPQSMRPPAQHLADSIVGKRLSATEAQDILELFQSFHVKLLVYGSLLIERHATPRRPITGRIQAGNGFTGKHAAWELQWQKLISQPEAVAMLAGFRAEPAPDCSLSSESALSEGQWNTNEFHIRSKSPFSSSFQCQQWVVQLVAECDGVTTWNEHYEKAKDRGVIGPAVPFKEFAGLLTLLVTLGILRVKEFPLPSAEEAAEED